MAVGSRALEDVGSHTRDFYYGHQRFGRDIKSACDSDVAQMASRLLEAVTGRLEQIYKKAGCGSMRTAAQDVVEGWITLF